MATSHQIARDAENAEVAENGLASSTNRNNMIDLDAPDLAAW